MNEELEYKHMCDLMDIEAKIMEMNDYKKYLSADDTGYTLLSDSIDRIIKEAENLQLRIDSEWSDFTTSDILIEKDEEDGTYFVWDYEQDKAVCNADGNIYSFNTMEEARRFVDKIGKTQEQK